MAWTGGYIISNALDVARFYYDLMGPEYKILSEQSVEEMQDWVMLDIGFAAGELYYGLGLMILNEDFGRNTPNMTENAGIIIGHGGATYGFKSTQGYNYHIGAGLSLFTNQDFDWQYPDNLMCHILEVIFKYKGIE